MIKIYFKTLPKKSLFVKLVKLKFLHFFKAKKIDKNLSNEKGQPGLKYIFKEFLHKKKQVKKKIKTAIK